MCSNSQFYLFVEHKTQDPLVNPSFTVHLQKCSLEMFIRVVQSFVQCSFMEMFALDFYLGGIKDLIIFLSPTGPGPEYNVLPNRSSHCMEMPVHIRKGICVTGLRLTSKD